jgi:hypothetical protein
MKQTKTVKEMSVRELQEEINKRKKQEAIDKFSTKKETEFKISEVETLEAEGNGSLYHVRVDDGCEGWESLVEVDEGVEDDECYEDELVKNHIINFMIDNKYYEPGDINDIIVEEICRYNRPIFKISI